MTNVHCPHNLRDIGYRSKYETNKFTYKFVIYNTVNDEK